MSMDEERVVLQAGERALARIGQALVSELDLGRVADVVVREGMKVVGANGAVLWLADPARRELNLVAHSDFSPETIEALRFLSYDAPLLAALVVRTKKVQVIENIASIEAELPFLSHIAGREGTQSVLAIPLLSQGSLVGVIVYTSRMPLHFLRRDLEFNAAIGDLFAVAIEKARLYRDLGERERQVNLLLEATINAQEEERQRICLEIHDGVAQTLAAAFHYLQALQFQPALPYSLRPQVRRAGELTQDAIREAREVIASLRPAALDTLGLVATLRYELEDLAEQTSLRVEFEADQVRFSQSVEMALYRIIHEAINNVKKHAQATRLLVNLKQENDYVVATIRDDGVGVSQCPPDVHVGGRSGGVGLLSMRKRAELLGGSFRIESEPGHGTLVTVEVPLVVYGNGRNGAAQGGEPGLAVEEHQSGGEADGAD